MTIILLIKFNGFWNNGVLIVLNLVTSDLWMTNVFIGMIREGYKLQATNTET